MRGLLLKDAYLTVKLGKINLLMDAMLIVFALLSGSDFILAYAAFLSGILPMSLLSYDEKERWDRYAGTLPYTRAQLVSAKYLIALCNVVPIMLLLGVAQGLRMAMDGSFVFSELLLRSLGLTAFALTMPALLFPFLFRLGAEKGRIAYLCILSAGCAGIALLTNADVTAFAVPAGASAPAAVGLLIIPAALLFAASWLLSIAFYRRRELN